MRIIGRREWQGDRAEKKKGNIKKRGLEEGRRHRETEQRKKGVTQNREVGKGWGVRWRQQGVKG